ncbi:uncharacterized protein LOC112269422 [Brachypodium distachyon]|uniref:uncharacterized protein LOC112269422 n=1 Tax=Brachypodium distachyon TaxID=15368 RepID=UPI000D0DFAE3|nr:uncharacterized protein LOC112269422 [Brachypodium distachyon]|eukprot:XP_024311915.1 uncharacterized protein LOC112269422 [Brachypodium distachyon]
MASSSSVPASLGAPPLEKLTRENFLLWKAQVLPALRGAQMTGLLDATDAEPQKKISVTRDDKTTAEVANPAYTSWITRDQQVVGYLLNSLSKEILTQVIRMEHAHEIWGAIVKMFSSQPRSRITNLRQALANTKKGNMTAAQYISKMKALGDELVAAGRKLDEAKLVECILVGLESERCLLSMEEETEASKSPPTPQLADVEAIVAAVETVDAAEAVFAMLQPPTTIKVDQSRWTWSWRIVYSTRCHMPNLPESWPPGQ